MIAKPRERQVTQQQIADSVGVSRQLVTHALSGTRGARMSDEVRAKIETAAHDLNYRPRNLTTHNIGYVLPLNESYLEGEHILALAIERAAHAANHRLLITGVRNEEDFRTLPKVLNAKTVDGVISPAWFGGRLREALPEEAPCVLVANEDGMDDAEDVVSTDYLQAGAAMAKYLIDYGHQRIGLIIAPADVKQHRELRDGIMQQMQRAGLPIDNFYLCRTVREDASQRLTELILRPDAPTAWIAASPSFTLTTLLILHSLGRTIPEQVSLLAFFDTPHFAVLPVPISATTALGSEVANRCVRRLLKKIENPNTAGRHELLSVEIIERQSVAAPPRAK